MKQKNNENAWEWHTDFVGQRMQSNYWEYHIIGTIIRDNPQITKICELGTGGGTLTMLLGLWGIKLGIPVLSVDINSELSKPVKSVFDALHITFLTGDIFGKLQQDINSFINKQNKPAYLICDDGDKIKEVNIFAPMLNPLSLISAHDWTYEISEKDVKQVLLDNNYTSWKPQQWLEKNCQFATWIRKE
jgi:predicted O-methyltransferase YrrM